MDENNKLNISSKKIEYYLKLVMCEVEKAIIEGNPPFGAILIDNQENIIVSSHNTTITDCDPTAHGEINALRMAGKSLKSINLKGLIAIVNTEPCSMCMSAFIKAGIRQVYFGATQEEGNNPNLRAREIAKKSVHEVILQGGFLESKTKEQVARGRLSVQGKITSFK